MNTDYKEVKDLSRYIKIYLLVSLVIVIFTLIFSLGNEGLYSQEICWTFKCVNNVFIAVSGTVSIIDLLLKILVAFVTVFGVIHALNNYLSSIDASRSNIHLTHLNTFKNYLTSEVDVHNGLKIKNFNTFKWYNIAFPGSNIGKLEIGDDYKKLIDDINHQVKISNDMVSSITPKGFDYKEHQTRIISVLAKVGIKLPRLPRNDFYELEGEIFYLINKVNQEFCFINNKIFKREYI
ncbi:MAG TPA: hypothetical protein DDW91_06790 [Shewanella frigidimarina]|nr:hypothetical protein [Shewanella frigidimarina]